MLKINKGSISRFANVSITVAHKMGFIIFHYLFEGGGIAIQGSLISFLFLRTPRFPVDNVVLTYLQHHPNQRYARDLLFID